MDRRAQPAGEGQSREGILDRAGPAGKRMRVPGVTTLEAANQYLETEFVPWVNATLAVAPANPDNAHRPLEKQHDLAAILSHVEKRRVNNDYTFPLQAKLYRIARQDVRAGVRGSYIRVEQRGDGSVAARLGDGYLRVERCEQRPKATPAKPVKTKSASKPVKRSSWLDTFDLKKAPKLWQAVGDSGGKREIL